MAVLCFDTTDADGLDFGSGVFESGEDLAKTCSADDLLDNVLAELEISIADVAFRARIVLRTFESRIQFRCLSSLHLLWQRFLLLR